MDAFHYEEKGNRCISKITILYLFTKAGTYIFNLGWSAFFEFTIRYVLLLIHCFYIEEELRREHVLNHEEVPFLEAHMFVVMKMACCIGTFLFMSSVQEATLTYPWLPTLLQGFNVIFWTVNVAYGLVTNFYALFFWMMIVGGLAGTEFVNFLFLAVAKTTHENDMELNIYERELTVNLLLMAFDLGGFYAFYAFNIYVTQVDPTIIYHQPK